MGLDMYAYSFWADTLTGDDAEAWKRGVDFKVGNDAEVGEVAYWRKHPNLHGWMEALYRKRGGTDEQFNVVNLRLDESDLAALEADVLADRLPETTGFFFGASDPDRLEEDLAFIKMARAELAKGRGVYYTSWW